MEYISDSDGFQELLHNVLEDVAETTEDIEDAVLLKTESKEDQALAGKKRGLKLLRNVGVYVMKKVIQLAAIATIVTVIPLTGLAEDNQVTAVLKQQTLSGNTTTEQVVQVDGTNSGWFASSLSVVGNVTKSIGDGMSKGKEVLGRMHNPQEAVMQAEQKIAALKRINAELRAEKVTRFIDAEYDYTAASQCLPYIINLVKAAKPVTAIPTLQGE